MQVYIQQHTYVSIYDNQTKLKIVKPLEAAPFMVRNCKEKQYRLIYIKIYRHSFLKSKPKTRKNILMVNWNELQFFHSSVHCKGNTTIAMKTSSSKSWFLIIIFLSKESRIFRKITDSRART